jgi:hypothetical protein
VSNATYNQIVTTIATKLSEVDGVGKVHTYERYVKTKEEFELWFMDHSQGRICGWTITRGSFTDEQNTNISNTRRSKFILRGYMAVKDADKTELIFQNLIDLVCTKFRPQELLEDVLEINEPLQGDVIGYGEYCGTFCHICELSMVTQEFYNS